MDVAPHLVVSNPNAQQRKISLSMIEMYAYMRYI
jgi:hypothetical protein